MNMIVGSFPLQIQEFICNVEPLGDSTKKRLVTSTAVPTWAVRRDRRPMLPTISRQIFSTIPIQMAMQDSHHAKICSPTLHWCSIAPTWACKRRIHCGHQQDHHGGSETLQARIIDALMKDAHIITEWGLWLVQRIGRCIFEQFEIITSRINDYSGMQTFNSCHWRQEKLEHSHHDLTALRNRHFFPLVLLRMFCQILQFKHTRS